MNKLRVVLTLIIVLVMVTSTPLCILAIALEDYDDITFDEFQSQVTKWQNGVPSYEEAVELLDTIYQDSDFAHQTTSGSPTTHSYADGYDTLESVPSGGFEGVPPQLDPVELYTDLSGQNWAVGLKVKLSEGQLIRQGSNTSYPAHTCVPVNNWDVLVIGGPRYANGFTWFAIDRHALDLLPTSGTGWVAVDAPSEIVIPCSAAPIIPIADKIAPTIDLISIYASPVTTGSTNSLAVQVLLSDNVDIAIAGLSYNGHNLALTPVSVDPTTGIGTYEGVIHNVQINDPIIFTIIAIDGAGNVTAIDFKYFNGRTELLGLYHCTVDECPSLLTVFRGKKRNPVTTDMGNKVEIIPVIAYAGPGAAAIDFNLTYNSQSNTKGYFGNGISSPIDMALGIFNNALFKGVRVTYPDGHTADFTQTTVCSFQPLLPHTYDTMACHNGGYRLTTVYQEIYDFDADGRLIAIRDLNDNHLTIQYTNDKPTLLLSDTGRQLEFFYNTDDLITEIRGTGGKTVLFSYTNSRLDSMTDPMSGVWTFFYEEREGGLSLDSQGRVTDTTWYLLTQVVTPQGRTKNWQSYDADGRVLMQRVGDTAIVSFNYGANDTTIITDTNTSITIHKYDTDGRLIAVTDGNGETEHFTYTNFIRTGWTDKNGNLWSYTADAHGNMLSADGPLTFHEEWEYNAFNQVTKYTDALGRVTEYVYDANGNLTQIHNPTSDIQYLFYNNRGQPTKIIDFSGRIREYTYNVGGDLISFTDGEGKVTNYTYDASGRLATVTYPETDTYEYQYDANDNIIRIDGPLSWFVEYHHDKDDILIEEIDAMSGRSTYTYDTSGRLTTSCNQLSICVRYGYEAMGHLQQITEQIDDTRSRSVTFGFDGEYRIISMTTAPLATVYQFEYDPTGNLTTEIDPEGHITKTIYDGLNHPTEVIQNFVAGAPNTADTNVQTLYDYDLVGNLTRVTDAEGNRTNFTFNALNQMTATEDMLSRIWHYDYLPTGELVGVINPRSATTLFGYDDNGRLVSIRDAETNTTSFEFDGNGNQINMVNGRGIVTHYKYDALDRLIEQIENFRPGITSDSETNVSTHLEYNLRDDVVAITDGRGNTSHYEYDAISRLIHSIDRTGAESFFEYDKVNNLTGIVDDNANANVFVYNELDRLIGTIDAEIHVREMSYDRVGNLLTLTNELGFTETRTYDGVYRLIQVEDFAHGIWRYEYDRVGNVLAAIDANTHRTTYTYDDVYQLLSTIDPKSIERTYEYDAVSNLTRYVDGNGHPTLFEYNLLDHLTAVEDALARRTRFEYDEVSNLINQIAPDSVVTHYEFDPLDRLSDVIENHLLGQPSDHQTNVITSYNYDENGNLLNFVNPLGNLTRFKYDPENRVTDEIDALNNRWQYAYDGVGNLVERIDGNHDRTEYSYYRDNLLRDKRYPDRTGVHYTYDAAHNLTQVDEIRRSFGSTSMTYDPLNRQTSVTDVFGRTLGMTYDPVGNQTSLIYPDNRVVNYIYDPNDWLASATVSSQGTTTYSRDNEGFIREMVNSNNTTTTNVYDAVNQLLSTRTIQTDNNPSLITATSYTYDVTGMRTRVTSEYGWRQPNSVTSLYTYDPLRRLIRGEDTEGIVTAYNYDAAGNRRLWRTNDDPMTQKPTEGNDAFTQTFEYNEINQLVFTERSYEANGEPHFTEPILAYIENQSILEEISSIVSDTGQEVVVSGTTGVPDEETVTPATETPETDTVIPTTETEIVAVITEAVTPDATSETDTSEPTEVNTEATEITSTDNAVVENTPVTTYEAVSTDATTETVNMDGTTETITSEPTDDVTATTPSTNVPPIVTTEPVVIVTTEPPAIVTTEAPTQTVIVVETEEAPIPDINNLWAALNVACAELNHGLCNSLTEKVQRAANSVAQNDYRSAAQELRSFIQQVNNLSQLRPETAAQLTALANELITYYESLLGLDEPQYVSLDIADTLPEHGHGRGHIDYPDSNNPNAFIGTFEYDGNGSRTESLYHYGNQTTLGTEYEYDFERRLTDVDNFRVVGSVNSRINGTGRRQYHGISTYAYNALGTMLQETYAPNANARGFVTQYLSDGWDIVGQYNTQNRHASYFYRDDTTQLISSEDLWIGGNGAHSWFAFDGLGSVTGLTKHIGQSDHNYRYDEYGSVMPQTGNFLDPHNDFTFTGKPFDSDSGLYWFGSRHYDPLNAQWLQSDSFRGVLEIPQSLHRYGYVHGNPTNYVDEYGQLVAIPLLIGVAAFGIIGLGIATWANHPSEPTSTPPLTPTPTNSTNLASPIPTQTPTVSREEQIANNAESLADLLTNEHDYTRLKETERKDLVESANIANNKFIYEPNDSRIPEKARDVYSWSPNWNPNEYPEDYVECVTFINMVYNMSGIPIKDSGGSGKDWVNKTDEFYVYQNGVDSTAPRSGDVLVWTNGTYGHVAIVTNIEATNDPNKFIFNCVQANTPNTQCQYAYTNEEGRISVSNSGSGSDLGSPSHWLHHK